MGICHKVVAVNSIAPFLRLPKSSPVTSAQFLECISAHTLLAGLDMKSEACVITCKKVDQNIDVICRHMGEECFSMKVQLKESSLYLLNIRVPEKFRGKGWMKTIFLNFLKSLCSRMGTSQKKGFSVQAEAAHVATYNFFYPLKREGHFRVDEDGGVSSPQVVYCEKKLTTLIKEHEKKLAQSLSRGGWFLFCS